MAGAILKDAGTEPGALALVEFALEELYERSGGKQLTVAAYRALGSKEGTAGKWAALGVSSRARPKRPCKMLPGRWTRDGSTWGEKGGGNCARRVIRGGSWYDLPWAVRSANRSGGAPDIRFDYLGFRLAQDLD